MNGGVVFLHDGETGFEGRWSIMTTARSFAAAQLDIPPQATHWIRYTGGATHAMVLPDIITGNNSTNTCLCLAQIIENGVASGSTDDGIILVCATPGLTAVGRLGVPLPMPAFLGDTTLTGTTKSSSGTMTINAAQEFIPLIPRQSPKAALIVVETASINFTQGKVIPTVTAGTNYGTTMTLGQSYVVRGYSNIRNFKAINTVDSSGAIMKYSLYY